MQNTPQSKLSEREIAEAWPKIIIIKWKKKLSTIRWANLLRQKIFRNNLKDVTYLANFASWKKIL